MLIRLQSEFKLFNLDDGTMGDSCTEALQDLQGLEVAVYELGLVVNHRKAEIVCCDILQQLTPFHLILPTSVGLNHLMHAF